MTTTEIDNEALAANARLMQRRKEVKISIDPSERGGKGKPERETSGPIDVVELAERFGKIGREAREFAAKVAAYLTTIKQKTCQVHGCVTKPDLRRSVLESRQTGSMVCVFEPCQQCYQIENGPDAWKLRAGIDKEFMEATLENWQPRSEQDVTNLRKVNEFKKNRSGFLLMFGEKGTGKTHLAVGLINHWRSGWIITQTELLKKLRKSYSDKNSEDVIERGRSARLLVIDEMGLSVGGKDELPMLHEILNHRHTNFKPTVLIGNISPGEIRDIIGERMMDRLKDSLFYQAIFNGPSIRGQRTGSYGAK